MELTLGWMIRRAAWKHPQETALVCETGRVTYADLEERSNRLANALKGLGLGRNDKVALLLQNCRQFIEAVFGIAKTGAVCVPLNYRLKAGELEYILNHSDSRAIIYQADFGSAVESLLPKTPQLKHLLAVGGGINSGPGYEDLLAGSTPADPAAEVKENDLASLIYTAGTTGSPKGVMLTHKNHLWSCVNSMLREGDYRRELNVITPIPVFHVAGFQRCLITLYLGGKNTLVRQFEPGRFLTLVEQEKPTATFMVPTLVAMLSRFPDLERFDRSSLSCVMVGAAPSPVKLLREIRSIFPGAEVIHIYGLTEACATVSYLPAREFTARMGSVGKGYINTEIRVVNESGGDAGPGQAGEIAVRGPNVMAGYYKNPGATAEAFLDGGWVRTGDLGRFDRDGYLYVVDRKKDVIISGGENIFCPEVEAVLLEFEKIAEAAVIGVPDELWGETVRAVVVPKPGATVTEQEVIDFCGARLAGFKRPRSVVVVDSLPMSGSNKILKGVLRERYGRPKN